MSGHFRPHEKTTSPHHVRSQHVQRVDNGLQRHQVALQNQPKGVLASAAGKGLTWGVACIFGVFMHINSLYSTSPLALKQAFTGQGGTGC